MDASAVAALDGTSPSVAHARRLGVPPLRRDRSVPTGNSAGASASTEASPAEQMAANAAVVASVSIPVSAAAAVSSPKKDASSPLLSDGSPVLGPLNHRPALIRFSSTGSRSSLGLPSTSSSGGGGGGGIGSFRSSAGGGINLSTNSASGGGGAGTAAAGGSVDLGSSSVNSLSPRSHRSSSVSLRRTSAGSIDEMLPAATAASPTSTSSSSTSALASPVGSGTGSGGWEHGLRGSGNFQSTFRMITAQNELLLQKKEQKRQKVLRTSSQLTLMLEEEPLRRAQSAQEPGSSLLSSSDTPDPSPTEAVHRAREARDRERAARAAAAARYRSERERENVEETKEQPPNDAASTVVTVDDEEALTPVLLPSEDVLPLPELARSNTVPARPAGVRTLGLAQHSHTLRSPASADGMNPPMDLPPSEAALVGMQNAFEAEHAARQQAQAAEMNRIAQAIADSQLQVPPASASGSRSGSSSSADLLTPVFFSPIDDADDDQKCDRESTLVPSPAGPAGAPSPRFSSGAGVSKSLDSVETLKLGAAAVGTSASASRAGSTPRAAAGASNNNTLDPLDRRGSRSYNSRPSRLAALPALPDTPLSSTTPASSRSSSRQNSRPSSRPPSPSPGRSTQAGQQPQQIQPASSADPAGHLDPAADVRPTYLKSLTYSVSSSATAANGFSNPNSPNYLEPYGARSYATALATAVAQGNRSRSPSPAPDAKRHVVFAAELTEEQRYVPRSRSVTPQPMYGAGRKGKKSNGASGSASSSSTALVLPPKPKKSILRPPSNQHISQHMRHVVQQVIAPSPTAGGGHGAGPSGSHGAGVITTFSSHAPFVSPLSLLKFQVALFHDQNNLHAYCINVTRTGSVLIKYNSSGKPMNRWFYVQETADEIKLCWASPKTPGRNKTWHEANPNGLGFKPPEPPAAAAATGGKADAKDSGAKSPGSSSGSTDSSHFDAPTRSRGTSASSLLPSFSIGRWKFNQDRSRSLLEIQGIHYGPYYSANFCRFLDKADNATGKPWLCFSVQTKDRTIDLVCSNEHEVTAWFLGLQAQAPQTVYHMSRGMILWQRLIMKLNYYSLEQIKRVFAKREAQAKAANANANATHNSNTTRPMSAHK